MTYYVFKTKSSIANCADGNSRLFNLLVPLSCGCPSQVPHHVPLRVCQFINPSCRRRMPFSSPPGWLVLTVRASQWLLKDNQGFLFFLIWAQHITHLSLPSLSTWLNIVTSLMNYVSLSVSHSHLSSLLLLSALLPLLFQYVFYTVLLHSRLKASDFNKTIKKENRFYLVPHVCLQWKCQNGLRLRFFLFF